MRSVSFDHFASPFLADGDQDDDNEPLQPQAADLAILLCLHITSVARAVKRLVPRMSLSNSYVRASIVSLALFVAGSLRYFQKYGDVRDSRHIRRPLNQ